MKNLIKTTTIATLTTAFSVACASSPSKSMDLHQGRVIEYISPAEGFNTKTYFYEGEKEVVAVDAQFTEELAEASIKHLRTFTQKPISWLVITHPNPDKFNGANVFKRAGAKVVASRATAENIPTVHAYKKYYFVEIAKMFTNDSYPKAPSVDETFDTELTIRLKGGESILLKEFNKPGVSVNQTVALLPNDGGLVVGDLVHHKAHAWLEGGIVDSQAVPTLQSWIELLEQLKEDFDPSIKVYGGRGQVASLLDATTDQIEYLKVADKIIGSYINGLGKKVKELSGEKAGAHYEQLMKKFETKFPDYDLSYMIQYGVYGLVNSKL